MEMSRWTLVVEFDSVQEMIAEDDYEGGKSEAAEFYTFIRDYWSGMDETWLNEDTDITDETVTVTFPTLDDIEQPLLWLTMYAVPKKVELVRNDTRTGGPARHEE
jgi:hypothetical protein